MGPGDRHVFLNVPFDRRYKKLLDALVFAVHDCGLEARCALEEDDGGEVRVEKIYKIIEACALGIHDLSRTTLDAEYRLPRFNMPLELGVFLGARRFGSPSQRKKSCLILDSQRYRYQVFCSDIAGQDVRAHSNNVEHALTVTRNWLQANLPARHILPSSARLLSRYLEFRKQLPYMCESQGLRPRDLTYLDYKRLVKGWLKADSEL